MSRLLRGPALFLCLVMILAALPTLAQVSQTSNTDGSTSAQTSQPGQTAGSSVTLPVIPVFRHGVPWRDPNAIAPGPVGFAAPAGAHLSYFGGPIISNVQVIQVLYGSGSYNAQVAGTTSPTMGNFFGDITGANSGYITLLQQYNTNISGGTGQVFGNGTFGGLFQIVPSAANNGSTIDDTNIQAELLAQINAGHLPAPQLDALGNPNTLYMIFFPPGKTITQGGSSSCVAGGFCAYHGTTSNTLNSHNVLYGVLPDMQAGSGCSTGCGTSSVFGNYTSVTSHELTEALTDADVGIATTFAAPLAWYDQTNGEIGDICNGQQGSYVANGTTYTIQLEFSNSANNCVLPPAAGGGTTPNFTLSASPSSLTVKQGTSGSSTITVTPSGGFTGSVTLSTSALPSGVTASFSTNPTTSTSSLTFTASSTAPTGTSTITVTGTSGTLTHTTTISLTISSTATVTQLIGNPGFENGTNTAPWTLTAGVINNSTAEPPHSGSWDAWMDGYGTTHTDSSQQTVTIPSGKTSATLTFWLHIDTAETTTTTAFDTMKVQVFNTGGTLLATLGTFSNLNHATGYQQHSFSMNSFIGQTVVIKFTGTEDTSLQTSFVLDDVNLNVQ
ncbi:MAG TPA: hypothetical protein VFR24_14960 [Candidatus Angelobacter sp.]|nr:hypothetical protein [Candidatus Angelobacter sp.]